MSIVFFCGYISIINDKRGHKDLNTWSKRLVLFAIIVITGVIYWFTGSDTKCILNSAILAPVFWSWVLKPICKKFRIDYKQINLFD